MEGAGEVASGGAVGVAVGAVTLAGDYQAASNSHPGEGFADFSTLDQVTIGNDVAGIAANTLLLVAGGAVAAGILTVGSPIVVGLATASAISALLGLALSADATVMGANELADKLGNEDPPCGVINLSLNPGALVSQAAMCLWSSPRIPTRRRR